MELLLLYYKMILSGDIMLDKKIIDEFLKVYKNNIIDKYRYHKDPFFQNRILNKHYKTIIQNLSGNKVDIYFKNIKIPAFIKLNSVNCRNEMHYIFMKICKKHNINLKELK